MNPAEPGDVRSVMSPTSYQAAPPRALDTTRLAAVLQLLRCPLSFRFGGTGIISLDLREDPMLNDASVGVLPDEQPERETPAA